MRRRSFVYDPDGVGAFEGDTSDLSCYCYLHVVSGYKQALHGNSIELDHQVRADQSPESSSSSPLRIRWYLYHTLQRTIGC